MMDLPAFGLDLAEVLQGILTVVAFGFPGIMAAGLAWEFSKIVIGWIKRYYG